MSKNVKIWLLVVASILVLGLVFSAGCLLTLNATQPAGLNVALINQAWKVIQTNYVTPDKADDATLNRGAINGMVQSIKDPYSYYLNPDEYKMTQENFKSSFGGIGATISLNDKKQPMVVQTIKGSPAEKAGLKGEDAILAVDNISTEGLSVEQVVTRVRGKIGTTVKLTILRKDASTPEDISIVRAEINPTTVNSRMIENVAYIQITNFYERTGDEFQAALDGLDLKNSRGIIIDLRNNLGGYVASMVDVASHFIKEGPVITLRDNQGRKDTKSVKRRGTYIELPVVVLVNQYSASASEVLSGALQDYDRAVIAGVKTLGKGSYDQFFQLEDGSAIYLTVGRWLTPKEREIEGQGITPDYILTETGEDTVNWAVNFLKSR